jgi:hypothetical protein
MSAPTTKVCCCSPEISHDETSKFMIIKRNPINEVSPPTFGVDGKEINPEDSLFNPCTNTLK